MLFSENLMKCLTEHSSDTRQINSHSDLLIVKNQTDFCTNKLRFADFWQKLDDPAVIFNATRFNSLLLIAVAWTL